MKPLYIKANNKDKYIAIFKKGKPLEKTNQKYFSDSVFDKKSLSHFTVTKRPHFFILAEFLYNSMYELVRNGIYYLDIQKRNIVHIDPSE
jgi:hypothetical protein